MCEREGAWDTTLNYHQLRVGLNVERIPEISPIPALSAERAAAGCSGGWSSRSCSHPLSAATPPPIAPPGQRASVRAF